MNIGNQELLYRAGDGEDRVYCKTCDNLCTEGFYKNHLEPQSHTNDIYKKQRIKN